jgi:hypothetical protein
VPAAGTTWDDARRVLRHLIALNAGSAGPTDDAAIQKAMAAVKEVRQVASECLASHDNWTEYFIALTLCGLRATMWDTMPVASRRLMFLVSALAITELRTRFRPGSEGDTPSPDATDIHRTQ